MSSKKTIEISPELFSGNLSKTKKRREKKAKPKNLLKPNTLKKALLKRIKEHASKNNNKLKEEKKQDNTFENEFDKHIDYLSSLSIENKKKKTQKNLSNKPSPVNVELPLELQERRQSIDIKNFKPMTIKNQESTPTVESSYKVSSLKQPPYGCLKNGNKPTYRNWKKLTQKKKDTVDIIEPVSKELSQREIRLEELRKRLKQNNLDQQNNNQSKLETVTKRKTCKRKYKFGKNADKKTVSVLIKNALTRKNIKQEYNILKNTPISEVKEYLKKKSMLKAGSLAPNDVLRKTYEQLHLSGDINNKNGEILIHNYVNS